MTAKLRTILSITGVLTAALALSGCRCVPIGQPRVQSLHGRVAFDADTPSGLQIFSMAANGSDRKQLTFAGSNGDPDWSPNGASIAFDSDRAGASHIFVMSRDGSDARDINPDGMCAAYPAFAPDGHTIAFIHYPDADCAGAPDLWVMDVDGSNARAITNTPSDRELQPRWAPDGRHLVFTSHTSAPQSWALFTIRADGTQRAQITAAELDATHPDWSPNGQYIVFADNADLPQSSLFVLTVQTGAIAQLTDAAPNTDDSKPRFGPDSRHIVFSSSARTPGNSDFDLYVIDRIQPLHGTHAPTAIDITGTPSGAEFFSSWTAVG